MCGREALVTGRVKKRIPTCIAAVCLAAFFEPIAAHAAFPGSNGDIVFTGVQQSPGGFFYPPPGLARASGIYVTDPDGTDVRPIKVVPSSSASPDEETVGGPAWSPDGLKIAYHHWAGDGGRIEVMNPDGSGTEQIGPDDAWAPAWSPDGSMIAFRDSVGRDEAIRVMDADGGNQRVLVAEKSVFGESAAWSPDCSRLAFSADGEIWTMKPSGRVHVLSGGFEPDWSPDGRTLVFWRYDVDAAVGSRVFAINADGTGDRPVREGASPAWSPDGRRIVFARRGGLATMNADGSDVRTVTVTDHMAHRHGAPDWQPLTETAASPGLCDRWRTDLGALPQLRLSVRPRKPRPEEPTRLRFTVTDDAQRRVRRAVIYFHGERTRTNARGRAVIRRVFEYNEQRRAVATKAGFRHDTATVRSPPES
jgi:hypothetical protein